MKGMTMTQHEQYTLAGAGPGERFSRRRVDVEARFFLPYLKPGMAVLDCGSGPGSITLGLAEAVAPGQVIGIDIQPGQVKMARDAAERAGVANVRFQEASVYALPFEDEQFDAVFAHAVFEHLGDPHAALAEMSRVVRSGGVIGIRSSDRGGEVAWPRMELIERVQRLYCDLVQHNGGNPFVGRELRGLVTEAGLELLSLSMSGECFGLKQDVQGWADTVNKVGLAVDSKPGRQMLELGWVTEQDLLEMQAAMNEWAAHSATAWFVPRVEVVARRP